MFYVYKDSGGADLLTTPVTGSVQAMANECTARGANCQVCFYIFLLWQPGFFWVRKGTAASTRAVEWWVSCRDSTLTAG